MNYRSQFARTAFTMTMFAASVLPLTGCGGGNGGSTPTINAGRASSLLTNFAAQTNRSGVSAAIVRGNALLWAQGTGKANKELAMSAGEETVYEIASVSKTVTAVAVMQLAEAGKLNLDRDINAYLPFKLVNPQVPSAVITLSSVICFL